MPEVELHAEGCDQGAMCVECEGCDCGAIPSTCVGGCWTVDDDEQWRTDMGYADA